MAIQQGPVPVHGHQPVWRYVRLNTLFHYLAGKAFIPSIKSLRGYDPTEGLPVLDHVWAMGGFSDDEVSAIDEWVHKYRLSTNEKYCYEINRNHPGANQEEYLKHYYEILEESRYAWCWFRSEYESAAMWQVYGKGGVAIRTSVDSLSKALEATASPWLVSGIQYLDRNAEPGVKVGWGNEKMKPWARRPFLVKRMEYQHEHEVRFVTVSCEGRSGLLLSDLNPSDWIEEIVFWPGFPRSEADALVNAVGKAASEMSKRTRSSKLFQRDPNAASFPDAEDALDALVANSCRQAAQNWPTFMLQP